MNSIAKFKDETPLVSVILPVFNAEKYISEAIESIVNQSYSNIELIIVNDGSTDNSSNISNDYSKIDKRIQVVHKKNEGIVSALNCGLSIATGKYIARMDADDVSLRDRIEKQVAYMESHPECILCGGQVNFIGSRSGYSELPTNQNDCELQMLFSTPVFHPCAFFLKTDIKYEIEFKDAEDYRYWFKLSRIGKITNLPDVILNYRVHKGQLSRLYNKSQITNQIYISHNLICNKINMDVKRNAYLNSMSELLSSLDINYNSIKLIERELYYLMAFFGNSGVMVYIKFCMKNDCVSPVRLITLLLRAIKWRKYNYKYI